MINENDFFSWACYQYKRQIHQTVRDNLTFFIKYFFFHDLIIENKINNQLLQQKWESNTTLKGVITSKKDDYNQKEFQIFN